MKKFKDVDAWRGARRTAEFQDEVEKRVHITKTILQTRRRKLR